MQHLIRLKSTLLILLLSPFLIQCFATTQELKNLDLRLRSMDNKLINMNRGMDDLQEETTNRANKNSVEALQKNLADSANTIDHLKTNLLQVKGQMEENAYHYKKLEEAATDYRDSMSGRLHDTNAAIEDLKTTIDTLQKQQQALETRIIANEDLLKQISSGLDSVKQARAEEAAAQARKAAEAAAAAARRAEEARARAKEKAEAEERARREQAAAKIRAKTGAPRVIAPDKEKKKISKKTSPARKQQITVTTSDKTDNLYDKGIALFNANKFKDAYAAFSEYVEKFPTGTLVANARFWLGDSLYNQKEYELAILEYQKVIADYPENNKAPAALLKQGLAFEKLKDSETAKLVYFKLIDDYPDSEQAKVAKQKLNNL